MKLPKSAILIWESMPDEYERGTIIQVFTVPRKGNTGGYYIRRRIETLQGGDSFLKIITNSEASELAGCAL